MTEKTYNTTIDFLFVRSGQQSEPEMMTLKWIRANKDEVISIISKLKSAELIAANGGTIEQILWAKIDTAQYLAATVKTLELQISVESGVHPSDYWRGSTKTTTTHQQPDITLTMSDDDFEDNDQIIMDID
jgi:hypothetical protein